MDTFYQLKPRRLGQQWTGSHFQRRRELLLDYPI